jgi:hypothetical protein
MQKPRLRIIIPYGHVSDRRMLRAGRETALRYPYFDSAFNRNG